MLSEDLQLVYATLIILGFVALIFLCMLTGFIFSKKPASKLRVGMIAIAGIVSVILMSVVYLFPLAIFSDLEFLHRCNPNGVIGVCRTGLSYQQIEAEVTSGQIQLFY